MKKTQSLKLMLLGLFALVSGSASAKVGEVFSDGMFIYQELEGNGAKIIAINDENGLVVIPDKCYNNFDIVAGTTQGKELSVVALDDEWYAQVKVQLIKVVNGVETNYGSPMATLDLTSDAAPAFELDILATQLKTISTEAIQPLNKKITKFVVAENAGLTNIPDFAFANCKVTVVANEQAAGIQAAIDNLTNQIKLAEIAIASEPGYWVLNGKYVVNNSIVYYAGEDADGKAILVILGEEAGKDPEGQTPAATEKPVYKLLRINPDGTTSAYKDADNKDVVARPNSVGDKLVYNTQTVASRTEQGNEQKELKYYPTLFVQSLAADQAYNTLAGAKNDYINGESYATLKQALDMKNLAINPDVINSAAYWKKLAAQVHPYWIYSDYDNNGESVSYNVTPAIEAALLAGNMSQLESEADKKRYKEVWDAMVLAGWPTTTTPETEASWAKGAVVETAALDGYDVDTEIPTATIGETSYTVYSKVDGETKTYRIKYEDDVFEATYTPAKEATTGFAVPNWTKIEADWQDAVTAQENAQKALDEACAYDPDGAGEAACMTLAELDEAIGKALTAKNAANTALTNKTNELANLKGQKEGKENELEGAVKNSYEVIADNEVLQNVEWNNEKIKTFGQSAFERCTKAAFDNKAKNDKTSLPATTETVGSKAFKNTGIDAGLYYANANIKSIGDEAFANTNTTYVNLVDAVNLKDENIGKDAWLNCPVISINLLNTQLTEMPDGLAERIQRTDIVTDCDGKYIGKPLLGSTTLEHYGIDSKDWTKAQNLALLYLANNTLTTVVMPKDADDIRDFNFAFCKKLNSITIPAGIKAIGDYAFAGTAVTEFDLQALKDLALLGDGAFAYNALLEAVKFAKEAPFESIEGESFECDATLTTIKLNDDIECLSENLFAGTAIQRLDLSKTQITVLPKLFGATETKPNTTFKYIKLPEAEYDDNGVQTRPGLQVILDEALAHLTQFVGWEIEGETDKYRMTIPSSVWCMRPAVFKGDHALTEVYAMDSKLTNLGEETFASCLSLKKFTFVTLQMIDPKWQVPFGSGSRYKHCDGTTINIPSVEFNFDDMQFFECPNTEITMTVESAFNIFGYKDETYPMEYSTVKIYQPTITLDNFGGGAYSATYFNTDYATWIKTTDATVYTAYQDLNKVYIYRAKHSNGYYKIPAANKIDRSDLGYDKDGNLSYVKWVLDQATSLDDEPAGQPTYHQEFTPYYAEDGFTVPSANWGEDTQYIYSKDDKRRPYESAAVIIVSNNQVVPYERHTKVKEIDQSTLDRDNELRITATGINVTKEEPVYAWWFNGVDDANFVRVSSGTAPADVVVFKLSRYQGTGGSSRLEVVWVDDEVTSIKDYVKAMNDSSDAIYNLQGVKVAAPQKGQLYIQNGKKFIQK